MYIYIPKKLIKFRFIDFIIYKYFIYMISFIACVESAANSKKITLQQG